MLECVQQGAFNVHLVCMWDAWPMHSQGKVCKTRNQLSKHDEYV